MRVSLSLFAAMGMLLAVGTVPSSVSAQGVTIEGPGVGIGIGRDRDDWRDRRWGERRYRERETFGYSSGCREVTVRERLPDGTVVIRRKTRC